MPDLIRPTVGQLEQRAAPEDGPPPTLEGNTLVGFIPYDIESRSFGSWREKIALGAFKNADRADLICTVEHDSGRVLGRHPTTLKLTEEDRGIRWECDLPTGPTGQDVREAVSRGDLRTTSWRMVVGKDRWEGNLRVVEEVRSWRDVAVVATAAYPAATAELRSEQHEQEVPNSETHEEATVAEKTKSEGLVPEDRTAPPPEQQPDIEARVLDAMSSVPKGEARALTVANAEPIEPVDVGSFVWDRLRPASVGLASGITVLPTDRRKASWPQIVSDVDPSWVAPGAVIPEGAPGLASLEAEPHKLAHRVEVENEVIDDSEPSALTMLQGHLATMLALKLDRGIFEGNPTADAESIRGLKYQAGVQEILVATDGAALADYDVFIRAVGMLRAANVPGPYVIVAHPNVLTDLALLKTATNSNEQLPRPADLPPFFTSSMLSATETAGASSDTSSAYVFAPNQVVLVRRKDAELELDRSRLFHQDMSELRGKLRADLLLPNPVAVVRVRGIKRPA